MNNMGAAEQPNGRITSGIEPDTLISKTLDFVFGQLPAWRDDNDRPQVQAENDLNLQLCKFLEVRGRDEFPMVAFHVEEPQSARRRVDLSATPTTKISIEARPYTIFDPFLVFEGKRLPTPNSGREREYVSGITESKGGIQRFKLSLHGATLKIAAMIGYIQSDTMQNWYQAINNWIGELVSGVVNDNCSWNNNDILEGFDEDTNRRASRCLSAHTRIGKSAHTFNSCPCRQASRPDIFCSDCHTNRQTSNSEQDWN